MTLRRAKTTLAGTLLALTLNVGTVEAGSRIAFLTLGAPQEGAQHIAAFVEGLRRLGYVEGRDVDIDYRYAAGDVGRLEPLARELTALHPDVLVGSEPSAARAFKNVAPTLPIVSIALTNALIPELIASFARPGGNVTGIANSVEGLTGKLVELALEVIPGSARIGFLSNPAGASMRLFAQSVDTASRGRDIAVLTEEIATHGELAAAFDRFGKQGARVVIVPANGLFRVHRTQIAQLAVAAHLPTVSTDRQYVEAGMLASYGVNERESYRRGAGYVARILKGAKPGDLPVEFPTRIELTINLGTAKVLGLDLPPSLIARADEVIE